MQTIKARLVAFCVNFGGHLNWMESKCLGFQKIVYLNDRSFWLCLQKPHQWISKTKKPQRFTLSKHHTLWFIANCNKAFLTCNQYYSFTQRQYIDVNSLKVIDDLNNRFIVKIFFSKSFTLKSIRRSYHIHSKNLLVLRINLLYHGSSSFLVLFNST